MGYGHAMATDRHKRRLAAWSPCLAGISSFRPPLPPPQPTTTTYKKHAAIAAAVATCKLGRLYSSGRLG